MQDNLVPDPFGPIYVTRCHVGIIVYRCFYLKVNMNEGPVTRMMLWDQRHCNGLLIYDLLKLVVLDFFEAEIEEHRVIETEVFAGFRIFGELQA